MKSSNGVIFWQVKNRSRCVTLDMKNGERAVLLKNHSGDWGMVLGRWTGTHKPVVAQPGTFRTKQRHQTEKADKILFSSVLKWLSLLLLHWNDLASTVIFCVFICFVFLVLHIFLKFVKLCPLDFTVCVCYWC